MRIAVTYENGQIFQHFGRTEQFKVYDVQEGKIIDSKIVDTNGSGHGALAGILTALNADVLICGGIGGGAQAALAAANIKLYGGVSGNADDAAAAFLEGNLVYNPNIMCNHHNHHHGEKDCLCLYVCPTGAADTENSIIDVNKCIGCGACAEACPSSAISMVPKDYPPQQKKENHVTEALRGLIQSKAQAECIASELPDALSAAVEKSNRLMAEDLCREAGFMLPQSGNTKHFLDAIRSYPDIPQEEVEFLLNTIHFNEKTEESKMEKWKCTVCGYIHEGPMTEDFKCPV